ncbi:MAG: GDP-L-fucose synthase [Bdellovibrionaceae bacterium]|nr:GDP-L-fucose synthase [Bdellovibrio sp.]
MKIYLTGASGMVGRNILESGIQQKHEVYSPRHSEVDLLDIASVKKSLQQLKPDLIIHCAGVVGGIQANMSQPLRFFIENLDMGKNLVAAAKELEIKKFLNMSSSCMYPKDKNTPLLESDILSGYLEPTNEGYALAKVAVTKMCSYITKQQPEYLYRTLIPCNLFGKYDKFDLAHGHMVPAVIRKIHEAVQNDSPTVEIWGDGKARREFLYTEDVADFVLFAIDKLAELPEMINVGLGHDYTILEYYQEIAKVVGFKGEFTFNLDKPIGMKRKLVDVSLATKLGWKSKTNLHEGLKKTYAYYLSTLNK